MSSREYDGRDETAATLVDESHSEREPAADSPQKKRESVRRSTSHLKAVPESLPHRERLKVEAERYARVLDKSKPFSRSELEAHGRKLLADLGEPEKYLGFT